MLVENSLVARRQLDDADEPRFAMLETIRQFAAGLLRASGEGEEEDIRGRHMRFHLRLATAVYATAGGRSQGSQSVSIREDHDNMRAALDWLAESERHDEFVELAAMLSEFWLRESHYLEGRGWLVRALAHEGCGSLRAQATALRNLAAITSTLGDAQAALGFATQSVERWESAGDLPASVRAVFRASDRFRDLELLLAIPEVQVDLPGGRRPSQTDLWFLGRLSDSLVSVAVEGKVSEPFGPTIAEWQRDASAGKAERLSFLLETLHLKPPVPSEFRYQLLHRTASAILLARRFHAQHAVMLVHSFSPNEERIGDFQAFATALGAPGSLKGVVEIPGHDRPTLSLVWVRDAIAGA